MPAYLRASVLGLPAVACILSLSFCRDRPAKVPEPLDGAAMRELARLGDGFLVWERNVAGRWQIWWRSLDGTKAEERLVPEEPERDHFCPKISPDGRKLAYLSYRQGETPYAPAIAVLWVMDLQNRKQRVLAERARSYFEDRAVVWFGNDRLCHVDEKGGAVELDLNTMKGKLLTAAPHRRHGWLVNPQKTHATSGEPEFPLYDPQTRQVQGQPKHGGCQPYFSSDGRWGFWMGGPGGPVNRMFLPTRMVSQVLDRDDPRMPADREYLYFPMLSTCGRLMAFGASHKGHDHFASDYDIFVVRVNRETLEPAGHPVRCTNFAGNDRFPDVFCEELPLPTHFVEGPTRLSFQSPAGKACVWRVNGRDVGTATTLEQTFAQPGDHWVEAVLPDGSAPRGLVHVRETRPPQLTLVRRDGATALALTFDEAVSIEQAKATSDDGTVLPIGRLEAEQHRLLMPLSDRVLPGSCITLSGVRDLAQHANTAPPFTFRVPRLGWPESRESLLLAWEDRHHKAIQMPEVVPTLEGKAFWSPRGGVDMRGGCSEIQGLGTAMLRECGRSGCFTIEAIITPMVPPNDKETRPVFSLESEKGELALALLQRRSGLGLWLATKDNPSGMGVEQPLLPIRTGQPYHIVLGYEAGRFLLVVNGAPLWVRSEFRGPLNFADRGGVFRMGASTKLEHPWQGQIDQLAIYHRFLSASEALANADHALPKVQAQAAVKTQKVVVRLLKASRSPSLAEISPYREALVEQSYEVLPHETDDHEQSFPVGSRISIVHWAWVNGEAARRPPLQPGKIYRLFVQPKDAHPELKSLVIRNDLPPEGDFPELLDTANW